MAASIAAIIQCGCGTTVTQYLDIPSLVSVSKSCKSLRKLAVEPAAGKLQSSALILRSNLEQDEDGNVDVDSLQSQSARLACHAPMVMNAVDFSGVARAEVVFPPNVTRYYGRWRVDESNFPIAFPMFAMEAGNFHNLEELTINVKSLIQHEEGGSLRPIYRILGDNLSRCLRRSRKLKRLRIFNEYMYPGNGVNSMFSNALLAAMVPVIEASMHSLEEVTIGFGDMPVCSGFPKAGYDFFKAILSLPNLRVLNMQVQSLYGPLLKDLVDASESIHCAQGRFPSESITTIDLSVRFLSMEQSHLTNLSMTPFISLCRNAPSLREVALRLPPESFDCESISALCGVMNELPLLDRLNVNFHGYRDVSGELLRYLPKFVDERAPILPGLEVQLQGMAFHTNQSQSLMELGSKIEVTYGQEDQIMWQFVHEKLSSLLH